MDRITIIENLKNIIEPFVGDKEALDNLTEQTDFIKDLNINSANLVDIILDVEDFFDIQIDNESMEKMLNIEATIAIVEEKLASK
ncbi:acyl carrier protein [Flavobacterium frigidarium]|jgi:acyl carrier protein|uniref:Acyl carrier protein n=1 Tax=Flavobacterium frigidarium TaxID=99286 RepID=A0ABV4KA52_9FLAO|tara:strand:- start:7455 stop:7709 length:255 start_codon:yes stop_codon:yes gene_type:complete